MMNLPIMQAPIHRKPLLIYLALSSFAIRAQIAQENEGGIEQPVYYIIYALRNVETHYLRQKEYAW